uniref:F-box domain-containing protein n=1 Tax=Strongyloides venezuelensis TaxID=75913 RepID=A0A0K0EWI9_STRVS
MEEGFGTSNLTLENILDVGLIFNKLKSEYLSLEDVFNLCLTSPNLCDIISSYATKMYIDVDCDFDSYSFNNATITGPYPYFMRTEDVGREKNTFKFVFEKPKKTMYIELGTFGNETDVNNRIQDYSEWFLDPIYRAIQFISCKSQYFEQFMKTLCSSESSSITTLEAFPLVNVIENYLKLNETYTVELKGFSSLSRIEYELDGISKITAFSERIAYGLVCGLKNRPGASIHLNWRIPQYEATLSQKRDDIVYFFKTMFCKCLEYGISVSLAVNVNVIKIISEAYNKYPVNITSFKIYNYTENNPSVVEYLTGTKKFFGATKSFTINFSCPCVGGKKFIGLGVIKMMKSLEKLTVNFCKFHGTSERVIGIFNNIPVNVKYLFLNNFSRYDQNIFERLSSKVPELKSLIVDSNKKHTHNSCTSSYFTSFRKLISLRHDCLQRIVTYPTSLKILVIRCTLENQNCFCGTFIQEDLSFKHQTVFVVGEYHKIHFYHNNFKHLFDYLVFDSELIPTNF